LRHFVLLYFYESKKALYTFLFEFHALCQGGYLLTSIFKWSKEVIHSTDAARYYWLTKNLPDLNISGKL